MYIVALEINPLSNPVYKWPDVTLSMFVDTVGKETERLRIRQLGLGALCTCALCICLSADIQHWKMLSSYSGTLFRAKEKGIAAFISWLKLNIWGVKPPCHSRCTCELLYYWNQLRNGTYYLISLPRTFSQALDVFLTATLNVILSPSSLWKGKSLALSEQSCPTPLISHLFYTMSRHKQRVQSSDRRLYCPTSFNLLLNKTIATNLDPASSKVLTRKTDYFPSDKKELSSVGSAMFDEGCLFSPILSSINANLLFPFFLSFTSKEV